jgi:hypothetical protein
MISRANGEPPCSGAMPCEEIIKTINHQGNLNNPVCIKLVKIVMKQIMIPLSIERGTVFSLSRSAGSAKKKDQRVTLKKRSEGQCSRIECDGFGFSLQLYDVAVSSSPKCRL